MHGTTPLQPETRRSTRDHLIRCGVELCTEAGFQSTGIEGVLRKASVPKGSFYHYFKSKQDFGLAVIDAYAQYFGDKLARVLEDESLSPLARLKRFVAEAEAGMARYDYRRGCLVGNLGQELAGLNEAFRERLEQVLRSWEAQTAACLRQAQEAGELASGADAGQLAEFFWIGWEGAILRAKLTRSAEPMHRFAGGFFSRMAV
ncbi:TetR family transcriptional regulator [Parapusillimonas sp. SGNA-6]|nr:TetR family transcriptional regulator [Parapusillimonas sp. SGNA-6]